MVAYLLKKKPGVCTRGSCVVGRCVGVCQYMPLVITNIHCFAVANKHSRPSKKFKAFENPVRSQKLGFSPLISNAQHKRRKPISRTTLVLKKSECLVFKVVTRTPLVWWWGEREKGGRKLDRRRACHRWASTRENEIEICGEWVESPFVPFVKWTKLPFFFE